MKRLHLFYGLAIVVVFLLTGQYMEYVHNRTLPDGARMLYRSRHIYLLLVGLLNLIIGVYFVSWPRGWRRKTQVVGSIFLAVSPGLLLAGFFTEPLKGPQETMVAALGIFAAAIGVTLHVLSGLRRREKEREY